MIWFTSDTHFCHRNILHLTETPFHSVQERDEAIIKRWNEVVRENDTVYVLGDFCFGLNSQQIAELLKKLKGIKILIKGNHDKVGPNEKSNGWQEICMYKDIVIDNRHIVMMHYPIAEWNGAWYGGVHLYGHCHGHFDLSQFSKDFPHHNTNCMDVGVDTHNWYPWSWDEIKEKLNIN